MQAQTKHRLTPEEYLAIERAAEFKSEYYNGEMFAMAGASRKHSRITTNLSSSLDAQLMDRDCDVYTNDIRVRIAHPERFTKYTYPDVVVVCGEQQFEDEGLDTLVNPTVIIEVLSESTEGYDRGKKFEHYRRLESLQEYVLVAQDRYHVECYRRHSDGTWTLHESNQPDDQLLLDSIECRVPIQQIYRRVEFSSNDTAE